MKISEQQIEEMAKEYAENENSAYTNDYYGFISGFKKALALYNVIAQLCGCKIPSAYPSTDGKCYCQKCDKEVE